jgi:hypothetical protein
MFIVLFCHLQPGLSFEERLIWVIYTDTSLTEFQLWSLFTWLLGLISQIIGFSRSLYEFKVSFLAY